MFDSSLALGGGFLWIFFVIVFAIVWVMQFVHLMSTQPDAFRGPHDRLAWVAAFVLVWPLAPLAFFLWRSKQPDRPAAR